MVELRLASRDVGPVTVVRVTGDVDVASAGQLARCLDLHLEGGRRLLVLDLGRCDFMDSTGLGLLVVRLRALRARGGTLRLASAGARVRRIAAITDTDTVLPIDDDVAAAVAAAAVDRPVVTAG